MRNYFRLNLSLLYWIFVAPLRGEMFKISPIFRQMVAIGVRAAPMVALTSCSIGVTLAMQAAHSLQQLGAEVYVPDLVMVSLLREMGPVLIAVIVIGRSGSAVAAELGTMKVSEEIEALEVMAINPVSYLIVPRFLAMLVMLHVEGGAEGVGRATTSAVVQALLAMLVTNAILTAIFFCGA